MRKFSQKQHQRVSKKGLVFKAGQGLKHVESSGTWGMGKPTSTKLPSKHAMNLIKAGKLPPKPKAMYLTFPKKTKFVSSPFHVSLKSVKVPYPIQYQANNKLKREAKYMAYMRQAVKRGKTPPLEVMSVKRKLYLWDGHHRFYTHGKVGMSHGWAVKVKYTGVGGYKGVASRLVAAEQRARKKLDARREN